NPGGLQSKALIGWSAKPAPSLGVHLPRSPVVLVNIEKLVRAEQSLAEIGEGLQFGRGFRGGLSFFAFLFGFLFVLLFCFRLGFRLAGLFLASSFQEVHLGGEEVAG